MTDSPFNGALFPANSLQAEEALLGAFLIYPAEAHEITAWLPAKAFYRARHRLLYEVFQRIIERGDLPDQIVVTYELRKNERLLEACGGMAYLSHLVACEPMGAFAESYASVIFDAYEERLKLETAAGAIAEARTRQKPKSGLPAQ